MHGGGFKVWIRGLGFWTPPRSVEVWGAGISGCSDSALSLGRPLK